MGRCWCGTRPALPLGGGDLPQPLRGAAEEGAGCAAAAWSRAGVGAAAGTGSEGNGALGCDGIWALPSPVPSVSSSLPQDAWAGQRRALRDVADAALQGVQDEHAALEQEVSAGGTEGSWGCG